VLILVRYLCPRGAIEYEIDLPEVEPDSASPIAICAVIAENRLPDRSILMSRWELVNLATNDHFGPCLVIGIGRT
jgi:hypothetical protein